MKYAKRVDVTANISLLTFSKITTLAKAEGQPLPRFLRHLLIRGILDVEAQRAHRKAEFYGKIETTG